MKYIPQDVINMVLTYYDKGHVGAEILQMTREHHKGLSEKTMLKIIDTENKRRGFVCRIDDLRHSK